MKNLQIPWDQIVGMRNILVHEYFTIDLDEIWSTVEKDLPKLKRLYKTNTGGNKKLKVK